jgi:hypothetical protein
MPSADLRAPIPRKQPDSTFATRFCGTDGCHRLFNVQLDARSGWFVSAATHVNGRLTIVTRCPDCGATTGPEWLAESLTAKPDDMFIMGRD